MYARIIQQQQHTQSILYSPPICFPAIRWMVEDERKKNEEENPAAYKRPGIPLQVYPNLQRAQFSCRTVSQVFIHTSQVNVNITTA